MILHYLLLIFLTLYIAKGAYNWVHAIVLRLAMYIKLKKICQNRGYGFRTPRFIFASFFRFSSKPDIIIKADGTEFLVRLITCRARKRTYHFVSHEWFVRTFKIYMLLALMSGEEMALFKRAKYLPPLDEEYLEGEGRQVVLLFNPSPLDITFTAHQSKREVATNGTDFDGWLIYNAKGFAEMLGERVEVR